MLIILVQDKNTSLKLPVRKSPSKLKSIPVAVSPLQLVNLHRKINVMSRQFKEKNKKMLRLKLKSALKIEQVSVVL
jgi:hypothetical protein